jgi:hypothetical protein
MATAYIGNDAIRETSDSGRITKSANTSMEVIKRGKYAALATEQPAKGAVYVTGYAVEESVLSRLRGSWGELVVKLVEIDASTQVVPVGALDSFIEVDMAQVEKPLYFNKKLFDSDSQEFADEVETWRNSPQQRRRKYQIPAVGLTGEAAPDNDAHWSTLTGLSLKVAQKIMKGIEVWLAFYPVVTRTSTYKSRPSPSNYGKIGAPPVTVPGTWVWLKTADRIVQNAKKQYVRTEQWTASDAWDTDLYETAT